MTDPRRKISTWAAAFLLLGGLTLGLTLSACKTVNKHPNVLLISVDTLRADRLGCYGYNKHITGMMDFWAQHGVRFESAYAPSPWTLPSHASVFTGLYPTEHLAIDEKINIDKNAVMLTEQMKAAGFVTAAFVSHYYLGAEYGFDRGFKDFYIKPNATADEMVVKVTNWLKSHKKDNFFLFLHLFDPHSPYQPPADYARKHYPTDTGVFISGTTKDIMSVVTDWPAPKSKNVLRALSGLYDGEIDFTDKQLEVLFKFMQENLLDQNTLVVLFSDHGEEFMEHGLMEHGFTLYQEQLHVPFIWYYPAAFQPGLVVQEPVSLIDLAPTLLEFLGLKPINNISGKSVLPLLRGQNVNLNRHLLAETTRQGPDRVALIKGRDKYIYSPKFRLNSRRFDEMLFNLETDPGELDDLRQKEKDLAEQLAGELFSTGLYVQRRAWHIRWGNSAKMQRLKGMINTDGKFIYIYKENTIYSTDAQGLLTSLEFPWNKNDPRKIEFLAPSNMDNGITMMTEPETSPISFHLLIEDKEQPDKIWLGGPHHRAESANLTLSEQVTLTGAPEPPPDGFLIWSEPIWVNSKQILRAEVGDPIKLSPQVIEQLRSLGYLTQ